MGKKLCIICDTPYQLMNTVNYICHQKEFDTDNIDILICNRDITEKQISGLKSLGKAGQIITYNTDLMDYKAQQGIIYRSKRFFFPKAFIEEFISKEANFNCKNYDYLLCAYPMPITVAFTMVNPKVIIRLMDDGIGTYMNGIPKPTSIKKSVMFFLKGAKSPWNKLETLYLNNITLYNGSLTEKTEMLADYRSSDEQFNKALNTVFSYDGDSQYDINTVIYLTQPLYFLTENTDLYWDVEKEIQKTIADAGLCCIVRKHPKQQNYEFEGMYIDERNDLWELVCGRQITDDHVLIGCYSTAQFSPKILFDREPWLVFTFELYKGIYDEETIQKMKSMLNMIKNHYRNKEKIIVINNIKDLPQIITKITLKNGNQ